MGVLYSEEKEVKGRDMKKAIPVIVAMFLILVIGGIAVGSMLYDKYSYSREQADMEWQS